MKLTYSGGQDESFWVGSRASNRYTIIRLSQLYILLVSKSDSAHAAYHLASCYLFYIESFDAKILLFCVFCGCTGLAVFHGNKILTVKLSEYMGDVNPLTCIGVSYIYKYSTPSMYITYTFLIYDFRALCMAVWRSRLSTTVPECQKLIM